MQIGFMGALALLFITEFPSGKAHSFMGGMKARQDAESFCHSPRKIGEHQTDGKNKP